MYSTNKKFKAASILGIIAGAFSIFYGIEGLLSYAIAENFFVLFDEMLQMVVDYETGMTYLDLINELGIFTIDSFRAILYVILVTISVISLVFGIVGVILASLCVKDGSINRQEFQKRNVKHVFFVISMGLLVVSGADITFVLALIAFILALIDMTNNKKQLKIHNVSADENFYERAGEENFFDYKKNPIPQEVVEVKEETVEEKIEKEEKKMKLEETFELLSKLEKSYKNGEIDEEAYKRMKNTILDNMNK